MAEETQSKLSKILDGLSKNIIFRLSLGSKELFHSNFWAWLLEEYKVDAAKIFYKGCNEISEVHREMNHTDLSFKCDGKLIIIENKFKSCPDLEQLKKYAHNNSDKKFHIIIVSYYESTFSLDKNIKDKGNGLYEYNGSYGEENSPLNFQIQYLSYKDILANMKDFCPVVSTEEHKTYISDYIMMLQSLIDLKEYLSMKNNPDKTFLEFIKEIDDNEEKAKTFNFYETIKKIFCSNLMNSILNDINTKLDKWGTFNYASRAKHVYMDIFLCTPKLGVMKDLGLQLICQESENLRKNIHFDKEKDKNIREKIDNNKDDYKWFYENTKDGSRKKILGYEYEKDAWLYRTCNSEEYTINNKKYAEILELYKTEVQKIEKLCE